MKTIKTVITIIFIASSSLLADSIQSQKFETKQACEEACLIALQQVKTNSLSEVFASFFENEEKLDKIAPAAMAADLYKSKSGDFMCVQKVGERQLGDIYFKQGYLVKYDKLAMFFEVVIVRKNDGYTANFSDFKMKSKQSDLLKEIPEYCWK